MEEEAGPAAEPSPEMVTMAPSVGLRETVRARDTVMVLLLPGVRLPQLSGGLWSRHVPGLAAPVVAREAKGALDAARLHATSIKHQDTRDM